MSLQYLAARLPINHPKFPQVQQSLFMRRAGEGGEREVLSYLQEALYSLPSFILHNFHVRVPKHFSIQIDYLVLTNNYILMIEVKNIKGRITFKPNPAQMIRELDGDLIAMDCPFAQLDRNLLHFKKLIGQVSLPIYTVIVWVNRSAILNQAPLNSPHQLIFIKQLPHYLNQLDGLPNQAIDLHSLVKRLKSKATPFYLSDICERYSLAPNELLPGLICMSCNTLMTLHARTWICSRCKMKNNYMLDENILCAFDLLGDNLQMNELRQLLPFLYSRNLEKLIETGSIRRTSPKKNRVYSLERTTKVHWIKWNGIK